MNLESRIRVLIVDDHPIVRLGLHSLPRHDPNIEVVGEASTAARALEEVERLHPDVVLLDVRLPDGSGLEVCGKIKAAYAKTRVLILTGSGGESHVVAAIHGGADGYLLKDTGGAQIAAAIHTVMQGGACFDAAVTRQILNHVQESAHAKPLAQLTALEGRILAHVAEGKTDKEVASTLELQPKTVRNYLDRIFKKLNVNTRTRAALIYTQYYQESPPSRTGPP